MLRNMGCLALVTLLFFSANMGVSAQNEELAVNETAENLTAGPVLYMFIQEAANGTFVKNEDGNYTLTLLNVIPYTMYFSNRPQQIAGFAPMDRFIAGFNWNYPNAALSLADAEENMDTVILAISSPVYNNKTGTLIYAAKILEALVEDRLGYHLQRADAGIPEKFGRATLFIDDCGSGYVDCGRSGHDICGSIGWGCCFDVWSLACDCCYPDEMKQRCQSYYGGECAQYYTGCWCHAWGKD